MCQAHCNDVWGQARTIGLSGVSLKVRLAGLNAFDSRLDWLPCIICCTGAAYEIEKTAAGEALLRITARDWRESEANVVK